LGDFGRFYGRFFPAPSSSGHPDSLANFLWKLEKSFCEEASSEREALTTRLEQGCQMVCFQTKNPNLGRFWRALEWKMMVYFMVIWNILLSFGINLWPFGNVVIIWYISPTFGILCKKSGNPGLESKLCRALAVPELVNNLNKKALRLGVAAESSLDPYY
jgi:hypothetical protein